MSVKYVMFDVLGLESPVLFPEWMQHADVARGINADVLSAGFVSFGEDGPQAYGESFSLSQVLGKKVCALPNDSKFIKNALFKD